jgi:RES domain-containing protein
MLFEGRWNTVGHAVTYCATSPSLCVLEKLVHVEDPALLPELDMVTYEVPDETGIDTVGLDDLPTDWRRRQEWTQEKGDEWYRSRSNVLLFVPSVIVAVRESPDLNVLINHSHPGAVAIRISGLAPFAFDPRLI